MKYLPLLPDTRRSSMENSESSHNSLHSGSSSRQGHDNSNLKGGFWGPRPFRTTPIRVGEEYEVKIDSLSRRGDGGVTRIQGLVVFVPGSKIGDSLTIRITHVGRGYATGQVAGKETKSSDLKGIDLNSVSTETTAGQGDKSDN